MIEELAGLLYTVVIVIGTIFLWEALYPKVIDKTTKIIEKNPKWITPKVRSRYYGLYDVDISTARSTFGKLPRFNSRPSKVNRIINDNNLKLELLIPEDTSVDDVDSVAKYALLGKIKVLYNLDAPLDKPAYWLSILLYMLDGGNIREKDISWEEKTRP